MASALRAQWDALVSRAWPVWGAALLVATVNVFLFAFDRPWTASDGLRNWGDWVLTAAGLVRRPHWSSGRGRTWARARRDASRQPLAGVLLLAVLLVIPFAYAAAGHPQRGVFLLFGAAFGVIFQRSRFCLVRAFREPFMTGDAEHTRAAALALVVSTLGFAILKFTDLKDKGDWVFAAAGVGGLLGGTLFGIGMTLAGGCGAGSIWRAGEGQVKLWAAVACFALGASAGRLGVRGRRCRRAPRRHAVRHRHDPGRRLRRGLDLARRRGTGEALGRRRVLRPGRLRRATGARRRAGQARHRGVPAGGRRLGR